MFHPTCLFALLFSEMHLHSTAIYQLGTWDVSTNDGGMASMFQDAVLFNSHLSGWDVGNVLSFGSMFKQAHVFNGDWRCFHLGCCECDFNDSDFLLCGKLRLPMRQKSALCLSCPRAAPWRTFDWVLLVPGMACIRKVQYERKNEVCGCNQIYVLAVVVWR